jgi:hypothetical protein
MDDLLTLSARELAEKGIEESHEHAEEESPGWTERAIEQFREYARTHEWFLTEDVREAATNAGFEEAPDKGAWGKVAKLAAKQGICHARGRRSAKSPGSHGKKMVRWRSGPKSTFELVTEAQVDDDCRYLEELAARCLQVTPQRPVAAARLREVATHLRVLSSDL